VTHHVDAVHMRFLLSILMNDTGRGCKIVRSGPDFMSDPTVKTEKGDP
jgi:hypothetical protein